MRIAGQPLLAYTIDVARAAPSIDRIVLSTDDLEIAALGKELGAEVPFLRPAELAGDTVSKWPVLLQALDEVRRVDGYEPEIVVDLDPTSPLRIVDDVERCIATLRDGDCDAVLTGYESERNPYFNMVELADGYVRVSKQASFPVTARQMAPTVYSVNASVYAYWPHTLRDHGSLWECRTRLVAMPRERSIDIDDEVDRQLVESMLVRRTATTGLPT
jgi:CMP-N-acetylneuraminic acid synthetase